MEHVLILMYFKIRKKEYDNNKYNNGFSLDDIPSLYQQL